MPDESPRVKRKAGFPSGGAAFSEFAPESEAARGKRGRALGLPVVGQSAPLFLREVEQPHTALGVEGVQQRGRQRGNRGRDLNKLGLSLRVHGMPSSRGDGGSRQNRRRMEPLPDCRTPCMYDISSITIRTYILR